MKKLGNYRWKICNKCGERYIVCAKCKRHECKNLKFVNKMKVGLTFEEIMIEMQYGKIASRNKWINGNAYPPQSFIFINPAFSCELTTFEKMQSIPIQAKEEIIRTIISDKFGSCWSFEFEQYLCKFNQNGKIISGWLPLQSDILAKDWIIYT